MDSARCSGPYERIPPAPGTNQIAGFVEFRPLTSRKKDRMLNVSFIWLSANHFIKPCLATRPSRFYKGTAIIFSNAYFIQKRKSFVAKSL